MLKLSLGLRLDELGGKTGGGIEIVELICGTEVSCDAYVSCDADTVWMVDDAGNYLVDDDDNYIIE